MVRGVLFDIDDTLVDHATAAGRAIQAHLRDLGLPHDEPALVAWREAEERHFARHLTGELSFQEQRRARVRDVVGHLDDAAADAWFAGYAQRFEAEWRCFDDVQQALAPDVAVFHHACALLGTEPGDTAFVGDRLDHDALGARDAGLLAVWLDRAPGERDAPDGVVRVQSLLDLEEVLG